MDPLIMGVITLVVVVAAYFILSRKRSSGGAPSTGSWNSFSSPDGVFSLNYPSEWLTRERISGPLSPGSAFVALNPSGTIMLEAFLLKTNTLKFYAGMWEEDQRGVHPDTRVLSTEAVPLGGGREGLRLTLTYTEGTIAGTTQPFTTDYFLLDAGSQVLSLNFKVLSSQYDGMRGMFEAVARSVRPGRG
jgi:hypothetical protein